ncbi:hypothetical protein [Beijerinckia indica]|uniref:Uncharacterized protein n=1 Tax=Beijerinckia indica subsp. indica (strain ATCC 9039 / DSM 1715 / NCIMB 8712) TaxID=395963 RepID=B2IBT0_BEII9|nr:hypothetical protein [Beijerinckia indica]ACB93802.1 hypothetical protein Bind_0144 [Beijerinckia indica subsp. indica ATCC 9039]
MQENQRCSGLLAGFALLGIVVGVFVSVLATGVAFAGGTPNDAAGAQGHDAPSSAEPTPEISEGSPDAKVLPDDDDPEDVDAPSERSVR